MGDVIPPWTDAERAAARAHEESQRCPECRRTRGRHWPRCSEAPIGEQIAYANAAALRKRRTIGPVVARPPC